MISLDSTHGTCIDVKKGKCYLCTIVCRCNTADKDAPLAWTIKSSGLKYLVYFWLENTHRYQPLKVMIDNADAEISAINMIYNKNTEVDDVTENNKQGKMHKALK